MDIVELAKSYLLGSNECECCSHISSETDCDNPVTFGPDPYALEIEDDDTSVWECDNCRYERGMDV